MSHLLSPLINCPDLQDELNGYYTSCDPTKTREMAPLVQFLKSPVNTNGLLQSRIAGGNGKKRAIELTYTPRIRETEVGDNATGVNCTNSNESGMLSHTCEIDLNNNVYVQERFDPRKLADICKDNSTFVAERISAMIDGLIRKLETRVTTDIAAFVGAFAAGESEVVANEKTVRTKFAAGTPDTNMLEEVTFAAMNAGYCTSPYVFGYGEAYKYMKRMNAGCCADSGLNLAEMLQQNGMVFMPSYRVEDVFGTNHFISMAAGAAQLVTFNEFEGADPLNTVRGGDHERYVIVDPITGVPIDLLINRPCDGYLNIFMRVIYEMCALPSDVYSIGDRLYGVTQINEFKIVNP